MPSTAVENIETAKQKWLSISCPECGKQVDQVSLYVKEYLNPKFYHKCGAKGTLYWNRKEGSSLRRARKQA